MCSHDNDFEENWCTSKDNVCTCFHFRIIFHTSLTSLFVWLTNAIEFSHERFFKRRFGKEFHDTLIEPFLTGVYAGNTKNMSTKHEFKHIFIVTITLHKTCSKKKWKCRKKFLKYKVFSLC